MGTVRGPEGTPEVSEPELPFNEYDKVPVSNETWNCVVVLAGLMKTRKLLTAAIGSTLPDAFVVERL